MDSYLGATNCESHEDTMDNLVQKVADDPNRYRVGATSHDSPKKRICNYPSSYNNSDVTYAKTNNLREAENRLLRLLPPNHPYNVQKESNIPPRKHGCVYAIDMKVKRDLSVGVLYVLPDTIFSRFLNSWQKHFCLFFYGFCANITIFASTFLIVVLTIDRLFVIIRPISASMIGKKYRYGLVSCAWLLAIIIGIPYAAHAYFSCTVQGINICGHDFDNTKAVVVAEVFINVVIPVIIISLCYTWIVYVIKRREKAGFNAPQKVRFSDGSTTLIGNFKKTESSSSSVITKAKKKTIKILLVVVIVYIVSWTPINVAQVLSAFEFIPPNEIFLFLHVLAPVNSIMNPLVFLIFNRQMFVQDRSRSTSTAYNTATHIESVHH
ncbi:AVPR2 [Mytilus edulis]|uniref:AVPR2 n=1 Tax=Mytilus edulis TaxID=6550 RepID=A0A8S3RIU3_MYTED|nr:AVPR2 [Mytilus edulis]